MTETEPDVGIEATFRSSDGGEGVLRQVALGFQPIVLIEPEMNGEDVLFKIDATDIEAGELADVLELLASGLRQGDATTEETNA